MKNLRFLLAIVILVSLPWAGVAVYLGLPFAASMFYAIPEVGESEASITAKLGDPYLDSRDGGDYEDTDAAHRYQLVYAIPNGKRYIVQFNKQHLAEAIQTQSR